MSPSDHFIVSAIHFSHSYDDSGREPYLAGYVAFYSGDYKAAITEDQCVCQSGGQKEVGRRVVASVRETTFVTVDPRPILNE